MMGRVDDRALDAARGLLMISFRFLWGVPRSMVWACVVRGLKIRAINL